MSLQRDELHASRASRRTAFALHFAALTAALLGGTAPVVSGCYSTEGCTDAGCISSVSIRLLDEPVPGEAKVVRACLNDRCLEADYTPESTCAADVQEPLRLSFCVSMEVWVTLQPTTGPVDDAFADGDTLELTIKDDAGETVVHEVRQLEYEELFPNGRECGPRCLESSFEL